MDYKKSFFQRSMVLYTQKGMDMPEFTALASARADELEKEIDPGYVQNPMKISWVIATAEVFGVSTDYLLGVTDEKQR